uniref:Uncharacterized protein n=1 Tax=Amphimedon queenslandica TaxID=400682 RepID=A0A1X7T0T5_AMPQE
SSSGACMPSKKRRPTVLAVCDPLLQQLIPCILGDYEADIDSRVAIYKIKPSSHKSVHKIYEYI